MLADSEFDAAWGSSLLFTTNMLAILLAGAATFVLTGIVPVGQIILNRRQVQSSLTLVGTLAITFVESTIEPSSIEIKVTGPDQPPSIDTLGPQLESAVNRSVEVTFVWAPNQAFAYEPTGR